MDTPYSGENEIANPLGRRTEQRTLTLQLDVGLTERFALRVFAPLRDIEASGMFEFDSAGLGDVEVWGTWGVGPELGRSGGALSAGLAFPTGRDADPDTVDENIVFGAGDYSLLVSAEGFRRVGPRQILFGLMLYRLPLGSGEGGYRFGEEFSWSGMWQFKPGGGPLGLSLGLSGQHFGQDEQHGAPVDSRGGRVHYLAGGLNFPLSEGGTIGLLAQHLIEQDVRGDQLLSPWNFIAGYSFAWGEHTHSHPDPVPGSLGR